MIRTPREKRGAPWRSLARIGGASRRLVPSVLALEPRALPSSLPSAPTADEQYMLQLINRARSDPPAEARRLLAVAQSDPVVAQAVQGWDLSAFVRAIDGAGASPPLAFNPRLIAAARDRDAALLAANNQEHAPGGFLVNPAYGLVAGDGLPYYPVGASAWATGENLFAYSRNVVGSTVKSYVDYFHAGLLIDWGNPDFGHLENLLAPGPTHAAATGTLGFSEIGIGLLANANPTVPPPAHPNNPANLGLDVGPVIVTQEFAWKTGNAFLAGAIYRDANADDFYTPGEGLGGVRIQALGLSGQGTFAATTWDSGGYSLALPPGTYAVTASGGAAPTRSVVIAIGQDNVGWDLQYEAVIPADLPVPADYDGDGRADLAVYRPTTGQWFIQGSYSGFVSFAFGFPNVDVPVPGDYDGDGRVDLATYRPTTGQWFILGSSSPARIVSFGIPGLDNPVPADYDGDGKIDLALYRPSMGLWSILGSSSPPITVAFGLPGVDVPVPADYDGDGRADLATYRPTAGSWFVSGSSSPAVAIPFGLPGVDVPVPGDYDGDGRADLAVYRQPLGYWFVSGSSSPGRIVAFGLPGVDAPIPADYDGDRKKDLATYRPVAAQWFQLGSREGVRFAEFGQRGAGATTSGLASQVVANYGIQSVRWAAAPASSEASSHPAVGTPSSVLVPNAVHSRKRHSQRSKAWVRTPRGPLIPSRLRVSQRRDP